MGVNNSIKSPFRFIDYKVDKIDFSLTPYTGNIAATNCEVKELGIKLPESVLTYTREGKTYYLVGMGIELKIMARDKTIARGEFTISGLFTTDGSLTPKVEDKLVRYRAPALLYPYLRATITATLASGGFGSIILPLINVTAMAKDASITIKPLEKHEYEVPNEV